MEEFLINIFERLMRLLGYESYARRWHQRGYSQGEKETNKDLKRELQRVKFLAKQIRIENIRLADENRRIRERFVSTFSEGLRQQVFSKSKWKCEYCGKKKDLTVDHFIPISKGGGSNIENLVAACKDCNKRKGNKDVEEFKAALKNH